MKKVILTPEKRQELTNWLLEIPAKFANPVLQFLAENEEVQTTDSDPVPIGGGGGAGAPKPKKDE